MNSNGPWAPGNKALGSAVKLTTLRRFTVDDAWQFALGFDFLQSSDMRQRWKKIFQKWTYWAVIKCLKITPIA
jgi:hypothetical protein